MDKQRALEAYEVATRALAEAQARLQETQAVWKQALDALNTSILSPETK